MKSDYAVLYQQIGRLLEAPPDLSTQQACVLPAALQWLGRGHALVKCVNVSNGIDAISFATAVDSMRTGGWANAVSQVFQVLYRAHAHCEIHMPPGAAGAFVPVGSSFDAFAAFSKIFAAATSDVMIVDPYMDQAALVDFGLAIPDGVPVRLLADANDHKSTLQPAAKTWISQYGTRRPLSVRLAPPKSLHDRAIFINGQEAWTITQSLKDFAKRAPAEIVRADSIAKLKIEAYEEIWASSSPLE